MIYRIADSQPEEVPTGHAALSLDEYQRRAAQTIPATMDRETVIDAGIMGMVAELGEFTNGWKKHRHQGHPAPDIHQQREELGDLLWHFAQAATGLGLSLDEIARANNVKLLGEAGRYPDGYFDPSRSIHRKESQDHA